MKKKIFIGLFLCLCTIFCVLGLVGCNTDDTGNVDNRDKQIFSIYNTYVAYAEENGTTPLSYQEWLESIKGEKGDTGAQGIKGEKGDKGDTGAQGAKGDKGDTGAQGVQGEKGDAGADGIGIKNTYIDKDGNLIIVLNDKEETEINAGQVVAPIKKLDENNKIVFDEIFAVNERTVSTKVSNDTESIYFNDYITILGSAGYSVYSDRDCENLVKSKTVDLEIGDNTFYILEYCGEYDNLFTVNIRRRPIYTVSFSTSGGTPVENQYVEEDGFAFEPVSVLPNNAATWDFDFSNPILENKTITATWHEVFIYEGTRVQALTPYGRTLSIITAEMFPSGVTMILPDVDMSFWSYYDGSALIALKHIDIPSSVVFFG